MSSYFDNVDSRLRAVPSDYNTMNTDALRAIEEELVRDVTVCAMFHTFPVQLRVAIHTVVLRYSVCMLPVNAYPADFETLDDHKRRIYALSSDLHTIFHEAARRGFTDSPLTPLRVLYARGEEQREAMVLALPGWVCSDDSCGRLWGLDVGSNLPMGSEVPCPRCGKPGLSQECTFAQLRTARGFDTPVWECPEGCASGRWASVVANLPCPACGTLSLNAGFTLGSAHESGLDCPVREA